MADELISKSSGREERTELTRHTVTFVGLGKLAYQWLVKDLTVQGYMYM